MNGIFNRKWLVATIATWAVVIALDEMTYYWWKKINPGSSWTGLVAKHPTNTWQDTGENNYPNGYRPAGAG